MMNCMKSTSTSAVCQDTLYSFRSSAMIYIHMYPAPSSPKPTHTLPPYPHTPPHSSHIFPYSSHTPPHSSPIHTLTEQHLSSRVMFVARTGRGQSEKSPGENPRTAQRLACCMLASSKFLKHIINTTLILKKITQFTATDLELYL